MLSVESSRDACVEKAPIVSVVMAAGAGKRMGDACRSKVCFEIDGEPVICRSLQTYEECGVSRHVVVVGHLAEQVREVVEADFSNVAFAVQAEQRGTGNAARCGADVLEAEGYDGLVLVVAGDRVLERSALERMIGAQEESGAGLVFLTGEVADNPTSGRVVRDASGRPVAIVEVSEIALSRLLAAVEETLAEADGRSISCAALLALMQRHFPEESKQGKVCGGLYELIKEADEAAVEQVREAVAALLPAAEIELLRDGHTENVRAHEVEGAAEDVNLSVYLFASAALYEGLLWLEASNAQGEEYLTDVVKYLTGARDCEGRRRYHPEAVKVAYPEESMGFNTPEELERIRAYCATKQDRETNE